MLARTGSHPAHTKKSCHIRDTDLFYTLTPAKSRLGKSILTRFSTKSFHFIIIYRNRFCILSLESAFFAHLKYLAAATSRRKKMERTGNACFSTDFRCFLPLDMLPYLYATKFLYDKTEKELHSYEIIKTAAHRSAGDRICAFFHVLRSRKYHFPAVSGHIIKKMPWNGLQNTAASLQQDMI